MPGGIPRGALPKAKRTTLSTTIPNATVAISQELEPRSTKGRTAKRSTRMPHAAHPRRAIGTAADSGQPNLTQTVKHDTAPSIIVLPWARLTVLDTIGDVEAERQQPVHSAKAETGNDCRGNQHRLHTARCSPARSRGRHADQFTGTTLSPT